MAQRLPGVDESDDIFRPARVSFWRLRRKRVLWLSVGRLATLTDRSIARPAIAAAQCLLGSAPGVAAQRPLLLVAGKLQPRKRRG